MAATGRLGAEFPREALWDWYLVGRFITDNAMPDMPDCAQGARRARDVWG